jgi:hypothetical protein
VIKNVKKAHQIQDSGEFQVIIKQTGTKSRIYVIIKNLLFETLIESLALL